MEILVALVIIGLVAAWVAAPFRPSEEPQADRREDPVLAELEARKQAKYREIRDTEMDRAQGKISEQEFSGQDAELRAEAIAILKEIDAAEERRRTPTADASDPIA